MKINGYNFLIGADPEFFVTRNNKLISAYGLIPGTKSAPYRVPKGAVQVDGMALEFNIDPADTFSQFEEHMQTVQDAIMQMIPGYEVLVHPLETSRGTEKVLSSVADFGLEYIQAQPDEAKELGCSPDFNAYTRAANPRPNADTPFRTASGHVHIGWRTTPCDINDPDHLEACYALTKALDLWLGVPSLIWDTDDRRRQLYGAAGAFRPKPYGMEYRVLSNAWVNNPLLRKTVYHNTIEAIKATFENPEVGDTQMYGLTAREIISKQEGWESAVDYALNYSMIRSPKHYR